MLFNVPQFIDIEDKIIGPFTAKQMGWMGIGGVLLLIFWSMLDTSAFIIVAIVIGGIFGALAFYRPYNQPLIKFITSSFRYVFRPRIYVWKRNYDNLKAAIQHSVKSKPGPPKIEKNLSSQKIKEISSILDLSKKNK